MSGTVIVRPSGLDLFKTTCEAIVIPTNAVGTQGAGIAKIAARTCRTWDRCYRRWCEEAHPEAGDVFLTEFTDAPTAGMPHRWYIAVLTKNHWKDPSELAWVERGLLELERALALNPAIDSIAIPGLGCGEHTGQLAWTDVEPLIVATARRLAARGLRVEIFEPWVSAPLRARKGGR